MHKILIVDDEKNIVDILTYNLRKEGYETIEAYDGEAGLELTVSDNPDLVLLDIMMPKMDGYEVCKRIRQTSQVPIIMLTARAEETDKVMGFELGADDYVTKPFGVRELLARVRANLRRSETANPDEVTGNRLIYGDLIIDLDLYSVKRGDTAVELTRREFELVKYLATQNNQVFSRENLLEKVWGYEYFGDVRTVDVTIRRLRTKLEANPDAPVYILTKRGVGYHFTPEFGNGTTPTK
jgi:two-component system response regulator VicR